MNYFLARILFAFRLLPGRFMRLLQHLGKVCVYRIAWWLDLTFLCFDLLFLFDFYELISNLIRSRALTEAEKQMLQSTYGDVLPYQLVRIDERARIGPPQYHICYVSFLTINSWGKMSATLLTHESMHVWQYLKHGAAYIPRALAAQRTAAGYNYGGLEPLRKFPALSNYNYEQQADIIADAFALRNGLRGRWVVACNQEQLDLYDPFLQELQLLSH